MGIIRKTMSISTIGMIDLRSDKERIARSTRHTAKAVKAQNKILVTQHAENKFAARQERAAQQSLQASVLAQPATSAPAVPVVAASLPPAGWFEDTERDGLRWWDGTVWTEHRKARD